MFPLYSVSFPFLILLSFIFCWFQNQTYHANAATSDLTLGSPYRLWVVLEDLPCLLLVAHLLDALSLQVALLALLEQRVGPPVPAQELGSCILVQD